MTALFGKFFGLKDVESIDEISGSFKAEWARGAPVWVLFGIAALTALALAFYLRHQPRARRGVRIGLAIARALTLGLLLLILADPMAEIHTTNNPPPMVYVLFDGTDSMNITDELTDAQRASLGAALGIPADGATASSQSTAGAGKLSRADYVRAMLQQKQQNVIRRLEEKYRVKAFRFDQPERGVSEIHLDDPSTEQFDAATAVKQLTADGQVTALGRALDDLGQRHASNHLAGVIVFSDFAQNNGPAPAGGDQSPARRLRVPVYTVGVGPKAAIDIGVDLQAPLLMKKSELSNLTVALRQSGLDDRLITVKVMQRRLGGDSSATSDQWTLVKSQDVKLDGATASLEIPYTPREVGRLEFRAEVDPQPGEVALDNNRSSREVSVRDDFLRLMFVEFEPTWEWRFIKEVFHRDSLVGMRGFRTFLRSSDPKVRQTNELFLPTMTPQRSDFFLNDVIFLGDMPANTITPRFCEMTKEFVSKFGGGLVVMAGPRFGPSQLAGTPLADMLPVVVDPNGRLRDQAAFELRLTPAAQQYDFMRLGGANAENDHNRAWANLGKLPWYQPSLRVHPLATVLAEHPTDMCIDNKTPQPLIAIRRYGKGEVIYLAFDETWRLRRKYGETYYRQLWGQMIHRLGLSHAIGTQKRFVVRTDQQQYQEDDKVILTVEAYDANFEPLSDPKVLSGELILPSARGGAPETRAISIPLLSPPDSSAVKGSEKTGLDRKEGVYELRIPVLTGGEHRIRVKDPVAEAGKEGGAGAAFSEVVFQVTNLSVERRSAVRNLQLEQQIASETGGKSYDLETVGKLPDEIRLPSVKETEVKNISLASTWLCFGLAMVFMLGEWLVRKLVNLA